MAGLYEERASVMSHREIKQKLDRLVQKIDIYGKQIELSPEGLRELHTSIMLMVDDMRILRSLLSWEMIPHHPKVHL